MLQRLWNHINQHGRGLVCCLPILDMGNHAPFLIRITPVPNFLKPMDPISKPSSRLPRRKRFIANPQPIPDTLPEGTDSAALEVSQLAPFEPVDEPHGLQGEETQRVEHVVVEDLARAAVGAVEEAGARYGGVGAIRGWSMPNHFLNEGAGVRVAFQGGFRVGELGGAGEDARDGGDPVCLYSS